MMYLLLNSLGIGIYIVLNYYQIKNINKRDKIILIGMGVLSIILGSKILDYLVNNKYYNEYGIVESIEIGYMFYGGIIFNTVSTILFCKIQGIDTRKALEIILPNMLLMYGICKIGCYFNNCCSARYGIPIQLIEFGICSIVYLIMLIRKKEKKISTVCIIFGLIRIMDFALRSEISISNYIINELISLLILFMGLILRKRIN